MFHKLKIKEKFYIKIFNEEKTYEIRKNDRDYQVGDIIGFIVITDICSLEYRGAINLEITDVFQDPKYGLKKGFCILSFKVL